MNLKKLVLTLSSLTVAAACSIANAQQGKDYNIYVYKDCLQIKKIQMSEHQINAYTELKKHESVMDSLEVPMKKMEQQLKLHERELDALSGEMVLESDDKLVVNKALVHKHTAIAHKMEKVVAEHREDIHKLELQARKVKQAADEFERVIQPSLDEYRTKGIHIQIGSSNFKQDCQAYS